MGPVAWFNIAVAVVCACGSVYAQARSDDVDSLRLISWAVLNLVASQVHP